VIRVKKPVQTTSFFTAAVMNPEILSRRVRERWSLPCIVSYFTCEELVETF